MAVPGEIIGGKYQRSLSFRLQSGSSRRRRLRGDGRSRRQRTGSEGDLVVVECVLRPFANPGPRWSLGGRNRNFRHLRDERACFECVRDLAEFPAYLDQHFRCDFAVHEPLLA